jgi:hypothetical protein
VVARVEGLSQPPRGGGLSPATFCGGDVSVDKGEVKELFNAADAIKNHGGTLHPCDQLCRVGVPHDPPSFVIGLIAMNPQP